MTIQSLQSIGVTDDNIAAIALTLVSHDSNLTAKSSTNSIANIYLYISTVMITTESLTITKVACYQTTV